MVEVILRDHGRTLSNLVEAFYKIRIRMTSNLILRSAQEIYYTSFTICFISIV